MPFFRKYAFSDDDSKYFSYYKGRIDKAFTIVKSKVHAGYICETYYKKTDKIKTNESKKTVLTTPKKYIILVLHPNYHGYMHCIKLTNVRPSYFRSWIKKVGLVMEQGRKYLMIKFDFPKVKMSEAEAKSFYNSKIRPFTHTTFEDAYRTFKVDRITAMKLIDFKFEDKTMKDTGLK